MDNIKSDIFWKRCYHSKFSDSPLLADDKKWINAFMERHFADILENTNPRQYDPEKVSRTQFLFLPNRSMHKKCASWLQDYHMHNFKNNI